MLLTVVDEWSSTSAAFPASAASLHGSNPLSLMFSSFQLPQEGFARLAQAQLHSILSTRESDPTKSAGSVPLTG